MLGHSLPSPRHEEDHPRPSISSPNRALGPTLLPQGTLYPGADLEIPKVVDTAYTQRLVPDRVLSVALAPHDEQQLCQCLDYGSTNLFKNDVGIVDTTAQPSPAPIDPITGLLEVPASQVSAIQSLNFTIGGRAFTLSAGAQLIPQSEVAAYGGRNGHVYSYVGPMGSDSGARFDFVLGQKFLERVYSVYDTTRNRVGLSYTEYTFTTTA
ncbi:hypothetical protein CALVIDRAFT_566255 [Calocera viscosa TUFC12733]|uniref:Peptidase A1 domain-containing protein n=1 Tax=Calocera viscosa (strain TUFC12733) TaxID=1330018 RepID=A0A167JPF7_CALVF|nr:hypothetical protein CALVIDRAFT_566255 [Calocera viscosa TUFC12733]